MDDLNKRQFIGGSKAYKALKSEFDASAYASSYLKKLEDDEEKKIAAANKQAVLDREAEKNKPNTFIQDSVKNIGDLFNGVNQWIGDNSRPDFVKNAVNDGDAKVDEAVKRGELTQEQADQLKGTVREMTGVGQTATEQFMSSNTAKTAGLAGAIALSPAESAKNLGEQGAAAQTYADVLEEMRRNGEITEQDYIEQAPTKAVQGLQKSGMAMPKASAPLRVISPEADARVKARVKEMTGVDYGYDKLLQAGVETVTSVPIVGGGTAAVGRTGKKVAEEIAAENLARGEEAFTKAQQPTTKLLGEPGENFYQAERQSVADELDSINNLDADYLRNNAMVTRVKDDARLKAEQTAQSPESQARRQEAATVVTQAEQQVKYYNDMKVKSAYHRTVDQAEATRDEQVAEIIRGVQGGEFDPRAAQELAREADEAYQLKVSKAAERYPQEAAEAPMLDQALEQATIQQIDAQRNLEKLLADEETAIKQSGGFLETPDLEKIRVRKQELEARIADIDNRVTAAQERARNPYAGTPEDIDKRIDDIQDPELSPENFTSTGKLKKSAKQEIAQATATRYEKAMTGDSSNELVKVRTGTSYDKGVSTGPVYTEMTRSEAIKRGLIKDSETSNATTTPASPGNLTNPTDGSTAPNQTAKKLIDGDVLSPEGKTAVRNLTHKVQKDAILNKSVQNLIKEDPEAARTLFLSEDLIQSNPNAHVALGNALMKYLDKRGMTDELGKVIDAQIGYNSILGRALRQTQSLYKNTPSYIIRLAAKKAEDAGKPLTEKTINALNKSAEEIKKLPEGPAKEASIVALRDMANSAGAWGKIRTWGSAALSTPRGLLATADLSFLLRQGLYAGTSHPIIWAKTLGKSARYAVNPKYFDADMKKIAESVDKNGDSLAGAFKDMKLSLDGVTGKSDEQFGDSAKILESKAAKKLGVGHIIAASDRGYTGAATYMRSQIAKAMVDGMGGVKQFNTLSKKAKSDIGRVIDTSTGRGRGGDPIGDRSWFESAAPALSSTLFAARFWKSNIDKINPIYYAQLSPAARKEALKNLASFSTAIATVLGAAAAVGADVETDPRSSDFGKIKVGDTRYDIMGGLQQNIVLAAREITGQKKNANGDIQNLGEDPFGPDRISVLGDTIQNKTSPILNTAWTFVEGKDRAGNEIDPWKEISGMFIPLGAQSAVDTYKNSGGDLGLTAGTVGTNFFGIGTNTYGSNNTALSASDQAKIAEAPAASQDMYKAFYQAAGNVTGRSTRDKLISQLYDEGKVEQARRKAAEFNALVDEKMETFFANYPNLDEELKDELRSNVYITITPAGEKRRMK